MLHFMCYALRLRVCVTYYDRAIIIFTFYFLFLFSKPSDKLKIGTDNTRRAVAPIGWLSPSLARSLARYSQFFHVLLLWFSPYSGRTPASGTTKLRFISRKSFAAPLLFSCSFMENLWSGVQILDGEWANERWREPTTCPSSELNSFTCEW